MNRQVLGVSSTRAATVVACVAAVVLVLLSPTFGRADPSGRYRPPLPPDALTNGCFPLPAGLTIDFPYQVRTDEDLLARPLRKLVLQYDRVSAAEVQASLDASLQRAGLGPDDVQAVITPIPRVTADDLVQGTVVLTLPRVERQSDAPECFDPFSTKRFAAAELTRKLTQ